MSPEQGAKTRSLLTAASGLCPCHTLVQPWGVGVLCRTQSSCSPQEAPRMCKAIRHAKAGAIFSPAPEASRLCTAARPSVPSRTGSICTTNGNEPSEAIRIFQQDVSRHGRGMIKCLFSPTPGLCVLRALSGGLRAGNRQHKPFRPHRRACGGEEPAWLQNSHYACKGAPCQVQAKLAGLSRGWRMRASLHALPALAPPPEGAAMRLGSRSPGFITSTQLAASFKVYQGRPLGEGQLGPRCTAPGDGGRASAPSSSLNRQGRGGFCKPRSTCYLGSPRVPGAGRHLKTTVNKISMANLVGAQQGWPKLESTEERWTQPPGAC